MGLERTMLVFFDVGSMVLSCLPQSSQPWISRPWAVLWDDYHLLLKLLRRLLQPPQWHLGFLVDRLQLVPELFASNVSHETSSMALWRIPILVDKFSQRQGALRSIKTYFA